MVIKDQKVEIEPLGAITTDVHNPKSNGECWVEGEIIVNGRTIKVARAGRPDALWKQAKPNLDTLWYWPNDGYACN